MTPIYINTLHRVAAIATLLFPFSAAKAQTGSDSLTRQQMEDVGVAFSSDNHFQLLMSGQAKFDSMFDDIRRARHSVHLEYFNFRNDSIASCLFDLLRQKRREGVEVRAMFDGFGNDSNNQPLKKHHLKALLDDSIQIVEFDPIRFPWVNHIWPRDHRKIVIIDGRIAYSGGMNVADYYIKGTEQVGEWRDMHFRVEGSIVNTYQEIFLRIWQKTTGEVVYGKQYFQGGNGGHTTAGVVNREPNSTNRIIRQLYIDAIDNARDSLKIINPYFVPTPSVKRAIKRAVKRGVKVDLLFSAQSDIPMTPDVVYYNARKLQKRGANVWFYKPGFHHSKVMTVDGRFCTVGSSNLDARSLRFDYEVNALILDQQVTRQIDDMILRDTRKCFYLNDTTWQEHRTCWKKFVGWFGHLLTPFL